MIRDFVKIKPNINPFENHGVKNITIREIKVSPRHNYVELFCLVNEPKDFHELDIVSERFSKAFKDIKYDIKFEMENMDFSEEDRKLIIDRVIKDIKHQKTVAKTFLFFYEIKIVDNHLVIKLNDSTALERLEEESIDKKIEKRLDTMGLSYNVKFTTGDFASEREELHTKMEEQESKIMEEHLSKIKVVEESSKPKEKVASSENGDVLFGREIKGETISLAAFGELIKNEVCILEGEVFTIDKRTTSTGKQLFIFSMTDYKDSVTVKFFAKENEKIELKEKMWIKVKGKKDIDVYDNNEEIIFAQSVNKIEDKIIKKIDKSEEKMVELHTHTKMSEMVGVTEASDIVKRAISYGHKAVAITDYGVCHSFPFAYKAAKGSDLKVIFGVDAYMVDNKRPMVENPKNIDIMEETYVVYDLETLGLNSHENDIIEIGAVKMVGDRIVDTYSKFVKPSRPISKKIEELTGINNSLVATADSIEKVLPEFMEFIGEATLVAHNAKFDIGFIKRDVKKYLGYDYSPSVIDTLQWARDLMPDLNGHGLKTVTKKLGVALENHHRAVDDSQATAQMFAVFLDMMKSKGATTLDKLDGIFPINSGKQSTYNIMLLAQNVTGLQNIYRMVSEAHLVHYGTKKPRITRTLIEKYREGILVGAPSSMHFANEGELISEYLRYNMDCLEEKIKFYDYIELQPRETYSELVEADATGTISSLDKVIEINKYFYNLAKENGKIVVGTSNVHYLNEEEAKVRSILLYGSGSVFRENQYMADNKYYFRTTDELLREFSYFGDEIAREIVIQNTNKINEMIEKVQPVPSGFYPPKIDNADNICREMTYAKAYELYGNPLPEVIEQRLERELKAIIGNGFAVLYLSAQKLVKESLDNGYLVGSRGSVGSSLVAYMMGITEVNALYPHYICQNKDCFHIEFIEREGAGVDLPEKVCEKCGSPTVREGHTIPFEVFMGFDGDKVPDIDLNFSGEYQEKIHRYCEELFGKENVFKAGTISTLAEKNAYGYVKKFFEEHNMKAKNAELIRLAKYVEGAKKTTGQHPGGMIVVPQGNSIYEFCPVQRPANDMKNPSITTHFDYHVMDEQLVKLDILGHDDPTTIKLLQELTGVDIYSVPLADKETLKLFSSTESLKVSPEDIGSVVGSYGVPEFGTPFVRQMLVDTKPTTFAELVRISGLSHGTDVWLNNAQEFIKQGKATLSEIISVRDDIMNFLIDSGIEKVTAFKIMEFVRKGMPSKNVEQWDKYSELMKEHKVPDWYIESCRRIKYMFPKGHAVAYVTMAMRIAYFKVHYPLAFYAAYLSRKAEDFNSEIMLGSLEEIKAHRETLANQQKLDVKEKSELALCEIIGEMHARGFEFLGIDVYKSDGFKFIIEDGKIRIPLIGLNGLGASVVENIVTERELGKFISYEDLKRRTKASGTVLEKLKSVNAIEGLSETNQISLF